LPGRHDEEARVSIGAFEPHWIGGPGRLYAGLHRPAVNGGGVGVLSVPPLLHEQPRSRRFITEVASGLAEQGLPCLRFDYFGTGDSAGNGDQTDFTSMRADIALAADALRQQARVTRVVALAWRGAALALDAVIAAGKPDLVVMWEPIVDGAGWLTELEHDDAAERTARQRHLPAHRRAGNGDGLLMGYKASPQLRRDIATARIDEVGAGTGQPPLWALLRADQRLSAVPVQRVFTLPPEAPSFGGAAAMDATLFVSPRLGPVVEGLGRALRELA
jgi:hypothetical protein